MVKFITFAIFIFLLLLLVSCSTTQRANRHLAKAKSHILKAEALGAAWATDTVYKVVNVVVPSVRTDTVFQAVQGDTVTIERERLKIRYVRLAGDSVFIEGECKTDTVFTKVPVIVNKEIKTQSSGWKNTALALVLYWC